MSDNQDFATLLGEFEREQQDVSQARLEVGQKVRGRVLSITREHAFISLGAKSEGAMDIQALSDADGNPTVKVGDWIEAMIIEKDEQSGTLLLGSRSGSQLHGNAEIENAYVNRLPVEGLVTGVIKGGVEVQLGGMRGFCPASQLDLRYVEDMESFVGQHLSFRISRYQGAKRGNLVLSRRVLLEQERQELADQTRAKLAVGAVLSGTVTSIKDYGAFVDLGGIEGMIHVSELAFGRVTDPTQLLSAGQQVQAAVLRIEKTDNPKRPEKIALSIRALAQDPWQDVERRYKVGNLVRGTVIRLASFGAFVELEPGVDGLVHISELGADRRIAHPQEVLNPGDQVEATLLSLEPDKHRIALSLDTNRLSRTEESALAGADQDREQPPKALGSFGELLKDSMAKRKQ